MKIQKFNMIEIMLAMLVISVALLGSMGLFPIGLKNNRQAMDDCYVALAADTMSNYVRGEVERYNLWENSGQKMAEERDYHSIEHEGVSIIVDEHKDFDLPEPVEFEDGSFTRTLIPNNMSDKIPTSFTLKQSSKSGPDFSKMHYLNWSTAISGEDVEDFDCIATISLNPISYATTTLSAMKMDWQLGNVYLAVRIEWPAKAKPELRKSRLFSYYLY